VRIGSFESLQTLGNSGFIQFHITPHNDG